MNHVQVRNHIQGRVPIASRETNDDWAAHEQCMNDTLERTVLF